MWTLDFEPVSVWATPRDIKIFASLCLTASHSATVALAVKHHRCNCRWPDLAASAAAGAQQQPPPPIQHYQQPPPPPLYPSRRLNVQEGQRNGVKSLSLLRTMCKRQTLISLLHPGCLRRHRRRCPQCLHYTGGGHLCCRRRPAGLSCRPC